MQELQQIPKVMELYEFYSQWEWRFGETPKFTNSIEKKFPWALVDLQCNVEKGVIVNGQVFSDCLAPPFIDLLNEQLSSKTITYDVPGVKLLCSNVKAQLEDAEGMMEQARDLWLPELEEWLAREI